MKIGSSMKIFVATKRGIKVLGNILIMSSMNSIIPQKIKFNPNVAKDIPNLKGRHDEKAFGDSIMYYLHMAARIHLKCTLG
jgi:hypothetical protein